MEGVLRRVRRRRVEPDPVARNIAAGIGAVRTAIGIGMLIAPRTSLAALEAEMHALAALTQPVASELALDPTGYNYLLSLTARG